MNNVLSILKMGSDLNTIFIIFAILGGLGLFLYGMNLMSNALNAVAGTSLKNIVSKATNNIFKGFLIGVLVTCLLQSSSATTVIVVGLISAGLIDLKHALPIIIGSRIGTTILSYIVGLDISFIWAPLIFLGAAIVLFINRRKWNLSGKIVVGLGLLFLGLELMSISFGSFSSEEWFRTLMTKFDNSKFLSFLTGLGLTALIQSSGAFIGIVQEIYVLESGTMSLGVALAMIIGSNIGTTITAILASLSGNKEAKEAALANTLIVVVGSIIFLPLLLPLTKLFASIENAIWASKNMFILAFFHTFFNIIAASIALLSVDLIVKIVQKIIPRKKESDMILAEKLNQELLKTPSFALESARFAIIEMSEFTLSMYNASIDYFNKKDEKVYDFINNTEEKVDLAEHSIHDYLMQISGTRMNQNDMILQTAYIDIIRDMERIADHAVNFGEFLHRYYDEKNIMTNEMHDALLKFFEVVKLQIIESIDAYKNNNKVLASKVILRENEVDKMEEEYRLNVHSFLKTGEVSQLDILFIDIVSNLERISDHTMNIAELIIDPHMMSTMITGEKN